MAVSDEPGRWRYGRLPLKQTVCKARLVPVAFQRLCLINDYWQFQTWLGSEEKWFHSYLPKRGLIVTSENWKSVPLHFESGVTQGTVRGSFTFHVKGLLCLEERNSMVHRVFRYNFCGKLHQRKPESSSDTKFLLQLFTHMRETVRYLWESR